MSSPTYHDNILAASSGEHGPLTGKHAGRISREGESVGIYKLNARPENGFFSDPVLFQIASAFHASLVPELAELGAYTAGSEAREKARLVSTSPPRFSFYDEWGNAAESVDVHPAYHSLLTRSRHAGIGSSLSAAGGEEGRVRHQARAARLFLLAGLESGHLEELCQSSAGLGALSADADLLARWRPFLASPVHDPSCRPLQQKEGASLALAITERGDAAATALPGHAAEALDPGAQTRRELYGISGCKLSVLNPVADGFIVRADFAGRPVLFLVPRLLATGRLNDVFMLPVQATDTDFSAPCCNLRFERSVGWMIGSAGDGQDLCIRLRQDLAFDRAVMTAGMIRSVLQHAVTHIRQHSGQQPGLLLAERILADAALDGAAASVLVLRLARALDQAENKPGEAALAAVMRPAVHYWLVQILGQIIDSALAATRGRLMPGDLFSRAMALRIHNFRCDSDAAPAVLEAVAAVGQWPDLFEETVAALGSEIGTAGARTAQVLRVAADMALRDEGAAFLLVEQLVYAVASAGLHALDCDVVAAAYMESRLGGQWRSIYGMLTPRYNARFILEALYPSH